ncbi:glycosyltransferase family 4 protein [Geoalkalibacter subterraneus]|uniref:Glycosyl transferase n=1 Tax=Geoalkalibacter subterraneus TaxID=483547 RepID=A0A0B5FTX8_9BACT|nr:glycosyltransferase family 4 protein [Geoalkalibacter subterraneus]AJF07640.1 hypothetical protein GSUB_15295 [Geoalkalibacter subterraneus]
MNIVFIAHFAGSPRHGMVYGHYYLAREWVRLGHQVTVVAASYAHTRFQQPDSQISEERIDGIRYIWLKVPRYNAAGRVGRVLNIIAFTIASYSPFLRKKLGKLDLVISSSHHPFSIFPSQSLAKKSSARLVFEIRDLWPLTLIELGGTSARNPFIRMMQFSEDYAYRHSDKIVSVLPGAKSYMLQHGMAPDKFVFIPNGVDLGEAKTKIDLDGKIKRILEAKKKDGKFIVGYCGRIGLANSLHTLVKALEQCADSDICVALLGDGAEKKNLQMYVDKKDLKEQVLFFDSVAKEQVQGFLDLLDVAYVGLQKQPLFRFGVSPTKINDYLLAGKTVISAIEAPGEIVSESGAGYNCNAEDPESLCKCIKKMKELSVDERESMGQKGHRWILENRDYRILAERFLEKVMSR